MFIGRLKADNKLNWGISYNRNYNVINDLAKVLRVWFFWFKKIPGEGEVFVKEDIKGVFFIKELFSDLEIVISEKTFRIPYWIKIFRRK